MVDQALINLVIAAREAFDTVCLPDDEERALDRALEPYSAVVPYADEPATHVPVHSVGTCERCAILPVALIDGLCGACGGARP